MNLTLEHLRSNRKWLVPNVVVWGNALSCEAALLMVEEDTPKRVVFGFSRIGGSDQVVCFGNLVDSRGNVLPPEITSPAVIIIPRNETHCFLVGLPSNSNFKIAYDAGSVTGQGLVDLLIMEMDLP